MRVCSKSDVGLVRESNQDACYYELLPEGKAVWAVVCDGMGGAAGGNTASALAVKAVTGHLAGFNHLGMNDVQIKDFLLSAALDANEVVFKKASADEALKGMGTTIVLVLALEGALHVVYAGDSRAYIMLDENIKQITVDHSVVQEMLSSGEITPEQAKDHPQKNIITRALGVDQHVQLDYIKVDANKKDTILVCTDGLTNHVQEAQILEARKQLKNDEEFAQSLIDLAKQNGGSDNITALIIRVC